MPQKNGEEAEVEGPAATASLVITLPDSSGSSNKGETPPGETETAHEDEAGGGNPPGEPSGGGSIEGGKRGSVHAAQNGLKDDADGVDGEARDVDGEKKEANGGGAGGMSSGTDVAGQAEGGESALGEQVTDTDSKSAKLLKGKGVFGSLMGTFGKTGGRLIIDSHAGVGAADEAKGDVLAAKGGDVSKPPPKKASFWGALMSGAVGKKGGEKKVKADASAAEEVCV